MCLEKTLHIVREIRLKVCEYLKNNRILTNTTVHTVVWPSLENGGVTFQHPGRGPSQYFCTRLNKRAVLMFVICDKRVATLVL